MNTKCVLCVYELNFYIEMNFSLQTVKHVNLFVWSLATALQLHLRSWRCHL